MESYLNKNKRPDLARIVSDVISYAYVILFLYAAFYKLFDYGYFLRQLEHSPLLGPYRNWIGWAIPFSEIVISFLLLRSRSRLFGLYAAALIMAIFTLYIVYILNFSPHVPCSCGGILATMGWFEHLVFNSVFLILAIGGIVLQKKLIKIFPAQEKGEAENL
ncbi:MauE/DoxX family redox-associated membrane protein [Pedobacter sp. Du54]|uniref:DoxX family protein n=1 Tax=Pedobacter anseongensis TaxID=3133439 RepID=UPI0030B67862